MLSRFIEMARDARQHGLLIEIAEALADVDMIKRDYQRRARERLNRTRETA